MLTQLLRKAVAADPEKTAIVYGEQRIRYGQLQRRVERCASGLRDLGISAGDCVVAVLNNCPEFVIAFLTCARLRAVFLPLDPQYTQSELQRFIADANGRVIIAGETVSSLCLAVAGALGENVPVVAAGRPSIGTIPFSSLSGETAGAENLELFPGRALYLYTSGSTQTYKRVCCTQENLFFEACNFVETLQLTSSDTILCTIPLYHSYGIGNCLLDALYLGATLVILEPAPYAGTSVDAPFINRCHRIAELISCENVRFYPGVPYQFSVLAALPEGFGIDLSGLRLCTSSGDFLPRQTYERFLARFGHPIRSLYGSTEAGSMSIDTTAAEHLRFGSLGAPLKNVAIEIRDRNGALVPAGQEGEIWVKSPCIPPAGYDNRPDLTNQVFRDGFYNTGDIGKIDARRHLALTGRKQTFVDVGGHKVDIGELEEVLQSHPQVREATALGVEISGLGTVIKAAVVTDGSCREADLLSYCRERLAAFKVPRLIEFRDTLPRSPIGKVLKNQLSDVTAFLESINPDEFGRAWAALNGKGPSQQIELLASHVLKQVAECLQCEVEAVSRFATLQSLGFDSLRVAELQQRLAKLTRLRLPVTTLWNYPSVDQLAAALWTQIAATSGNLVATAASAPDISASDDLDNLSQEELATLLARELNALEKEGTKQ